MSSSPSFPNNNDIANFVLAKAGQPMSNFVIYLKLEPYLRQWIMHENGGEPVVFPKNSAENDIIELGLCATPPTEMPNLPSEDTIAIQLPRYKYKDVRYNNYLPRKWRNSLKMCIRSRFVIALWQDLHKFGYIGTRKQDLIWAWMETHGIEATEKNYNTISKMYMRKRHAYRRQIQREKSRKNAPT